MWRRGQAAAEQARCDAARAAAQERAERERQAAAAADALQVVGQAAPEYRRSALAMLGRTEEAEAEARRAYATEQNRRWFRANPNGADAVAAATKAADTPRERTAQYLLTATAGAAARDVRLVSALIHDIPRVEVAVRNAYDRVMNEHWQGRQHRLFEPASPALALLWRTHGRRADLNARNRGTVPDAIHRCGGAPAGRHRALGDAQAARELLVAMERPYRFTGSGGTSRAG